MPTQTAPETPNTAPFKARPVLITPEKATELLKHNVEHNRRMSPDLIDEFARAMTEGEWVPGVGAIVIDDLGNLIDGQTRLSAVAKAGEPQWMVEVRGLNTAAIAVIDTGRRRTAANYLEFQGVEKRYSTAVAAAARIVMRVRSGHLLGGGSGASPKYALTNAGIGQFIAENRDLITAAERAGTLRSATGARNGLTTVQVAAVEFLKPGGLTKIQQADFSAMAGDARVLAALLAIDESERAEETPSEDEEAA